jgi:two-component system, response regulator
MEPTTSHKNQFCILIADDDDDDVFFTTSAFREIGNTIPVRSVNNGEELLNYLLKKGSFSHEDVILPAFILLDLNMPKKDGKATLAEIRKNPQLSSIPVIIFSTSNSEKDKADTARLGCTAYITKTSCYHELKKIAQALKSSWIDPLLNAPGSVSSPARHHA